jgi:hypothetical protein
LTLKFDEDEGEGEVELDEDEDEALTEDGVSISLAAVTNGEN